MARWWAAIVLAVALVAPTSAIAGPGVAIDLGEVQVEDQLRPGQRYTLPQIGVRNPGTEPSRYVMTVIHLDGTRNQPVDWVEFRPARFELEPDESQSVQVALQLPPDAVPGEYETLLAARLASPSEQGTGVGAAAASRLSFTIHPGSLLQGWLLAIGGFISKYAPWTYVTPAVLLAVLVLIVLNRRFSFQIQKRT